MSEVKRKQEFTPPAALLCITCHTNIITMLKQKKVIRIFAINNKRKRRCKTCYCFSEDTKGYPRRENENAKMLLNVTSHVFHTKATND